jgi:hypothetical protein
MTFQNLLNVDFRLVLISQLFALLAVFFNISGSFSGTAQNQKQNNNDYGD